MKLWKRAARKAGHWRARASYLRGWGESYALYRANQWRWWARLYARLGL